jgi:hypothetical protein
MQGVVVKTRGPTAPYLSVRLDDDQGLRLFYPRELVKISPLELLAMEAE